MSTAIVGAFEDPRRSLPGGSIGALISDIARGAAADAGLALGDVDGLFCAGVSGHVNGAQVADHLGLDALRYVDTTDGGGASYLAHVGHAAAAIEAGRCSIGLVLMGGMGRSAGRSSSYPHLYSAFEERFGLTNPAGYALAARRHMHEFGTTSEQLAHIRVAASHHAQFNPNALLPSVVTVEDVLESPMISDPLRRLDCCVTTDGGGALIVTSVETARTLGRRYAVVRGQGEAVKIQGSQPDLTYTGAVRSGPPAFEAAGVTPRDIDYVSLYDSFTITVLMTLEDLGFCEKGQGGRFVLDGALHGPDGALPFNTDGGGLCNSHPNFRGGMIRIIEAVRQLRGEASPPVQVPDCELALVQGHGYSLGTRSTAATLILAREDCE